MSKAIGSFGWVFRQADSSYNSQYSIPDLFHSTTETMYDASMLISSTAGLLLALLLWRFWKFHLKPAFHPEAPKELPYWIPCKSRITPVYWITQL